MKISVFFAVLFFSFSQLFAQEYFATVSPQNTNLSQFCTIDEHPAFKAIFINNDIPTLINKGMTADLKMQKFQVADIIAFSKRKFKNTIENNDYNLPYVNIKFNNKKVWVYGYYPFIFDDNAPVTSFNSQGTNYNVYEAVNLAFENNDTYNGYKIIVIKNTESNEYKLLSNGNFPKELQGHGFGSEFAYLEWSEKMKEKITGSTTEKHLATLKITANMTNDSATYSLTFIVPEDKPRIFYSSINISD